MLYTGRMKNIRNAQWRVKVKRGGKFVIAHTGTHASCVEHARRLGSGDGDSIILERGERV
jgi:hypothetical protein